MADSKTLYLIRHGKSSWGYENVQDMDRPLKNRGIKNAHEMSSIVLSQGVKPDFMISSPANRAIHTCLIFAAQLKCPFDQVKIDETIYYADETAILNMIKKISDAIDCLFIFGHNPIITNLANMFFQKSLDYIPTTGIAKFTFGINSWSKINKTHVMEEWYSSPKLI